MLTCERRHFPIDPRSSLGGHRCPYCRGALLRLVTVAELPAVINGLAVVITDVRVNECPRCKGVVMTETEYAALRRRAQAALAREAGRVS